MGDLTGQQLSNYRLTQHLGSGGFADVYLGENIFLGNLVAIKLLHTHLEGENARKFLFEAQTLVRLSHQHIIRVIDFRIERGRPMLIMDYVQGGSLRQKHGRGAYLPLEQVVHYIKQIAEALQFAHNQQIIHQDVKPDNVLVGVEQHLYLSDFGLALFAPSSTDMDTQTGVVGTRAYMAPEQWRGHPTVFSDQYALAIMAYEWLCGKRPFEGSQIELLSQHMFEKPQPLRELCPELPEGVERVVLQGLAKEPELRFASVRAFALALERASQEEITEVGPATKVKPGGKTTQAEQDENKTPIQQKLFIASASADKSFAEKVSADLQKRNIKFTYDPRAHLKQEEVLREAIRASSLVMIVASPQMRTSQTIREQLRIALLYKRRLVFVWARGKNIAASLLDLAGQTEPIDVIDARDGRYETALDEIVDCLQEDTSVTPVPVTPLVSLNDEPRNPYKGLRAFSGEDASDFFGRDALVQRILGMLEKMLSPRRPVKYQQRLLTVVGPSGSGKSSVVMAGVLPKLQRGAITGSEQWCYLETMVPGQHPCERLLSILEKQFPQKTPAEVRAILAAENGYGLYQLASVLSGLTNRRVVLCVDQFEELFAVGVPEAERQHFLKLLMTAITEPESPLVVILTLRADFYDRPMHHRELATLMTANQVSVLPMNNDELREAIERPTAQADVQLFFEGDLVGDLLFELHGQEGALPLLEFTLEQLFQQRQGHMLTYGAYRAIGGLRGALARHADDVYDGLPSGEHRKLVQPLFLRLIDPGKSEQDTTRRRMVVSELLFEDEEQTRLISEVAHSFISARLLTMTVVAGVTSIEVSHEALIREWPRLAVWLRGAREDILLQNKITVDAANWLKAGRADDRLYRGVQLGEAVGWSGRNKGNADEVAFVRAGEADEGKRKMVEEERMRDKLELEKRAVQRLRAFVATLSILLVFSVGFGTLLSVLYNQLQITAYQEKQDLKKSEIHTLVASANSTALTGNIDTALLLANAAIKKQNTLDTRNALLHILNLNPQLRKIQAAQSVLIRMLALDTKYHAIIYSEGVFVYIDDTDTGASTPAFMVGKGKYINAMTLSPDDNMVAIANDEGIWLYTMQSQKLSQLSGVPDYSNGTTTYKHAALSFSVDSKTLLSARCFRYDGTNATSNCLAIEVASWNMQQTTPTPNVIQDIQLQTAMNPNTFVVSGDAKYLAMSNDSETDMWSIASGQSLPLVSFINTTNVNDMALSPDGKTLAISTEENTIQLWNSSTGLKVGKKLIGHIAPITALAFNPNGQSIAASSLDQTTLLWNIQTGEELMALNGDNQQKYGLTFSSDGQKIGTSSYSSDTGERFLFWDTVTYSAISQTLLSTIAMRSPVLSSDGQKIYVGRGDGKIEILSMQQRTIVPKLVNTTDYGNYALDKAYNPFSVHSLALNSKGTILAAGRLDGAITILDVSTQEPKIITSLLHPHILLSQLQLSNNGQILVSSDTSGIHMIWDIGKSAHPSPITLPTKSGLTTDAQQNVALSPDGKSVAMWVCSNPACTQDQIKIWDIAKQSFSVQSSPIQTSDQSGFLTFSPDSHTIASIISGKKILLWDSKQATQAIETMQIADPNQSNIYTTLRFSPNRKRLVAYTQTTPFSFVVLDQQDKNPTKFDQLSTPIQLATSNDGDMSFSNDGTQLLSAQLIASGEIYEGRLLLWNVSETTWQKQACQIVHHELDHNDWQLYGDGEAYTPICS